MTNESKEIIVKIQATLEQILRENKYQRIEVGQRCECNRELKNMIRQINVLINNLEEVNEFALELSKGNLDIDMEIWISLNLTNLKMKYCGL